VSIIICKALADDGHHIPRIPTNAAFNNALPLFKFSGLFQQLVPVASTFVTSTKTLHYPEDALVYTLDRH